MGEETIWHKTKNIIAGISFKVFLWAIEMTEEEYLNTIHDQLLIPKDGKK